MLQQVSQKILWNSKTKQNKKYKKQLNKKID